MGERCFHARAYPCGECAACAENARAEHFAQPCFMCGQPLGQHLVRAHGVPACPRRSLPPSEGA
jgi:hypothetical protein